MFFVSVIPLFSTLWLFLSNSDSSLLSALSRLNVRCIVPWLVGYHVNCNKACCYASTSAFNRCLSFSVTAALSLKFVHVFASDNRSVIMFLSFVFASVLFIVPQLLVYFSVSLLSPQQSVFLSVPSYS